MTTLESFKTLLAIYQSTRRNISEDLILSNSSVRISSLGVYKLFFRQQQTVVEADAKGFWRWFLFRIIEFMDFFYRPI